MQHPKKQQRLLKALSRQGLTVSYNNNVYSVRLSNAPDVPVAEVLLPEGFPIEGKAFKQLANERQHSSSRSRSCHKRLCNTRLSPRRW